MRSSKFLLFFTVLSLSALVAAACGGGSEDNTPSPAQPTATASTSTQPTATPRGSAGADATPAAPTGTGTILDRTQFPKGELDNVKYGGKMTWLRSANPAFLDPKYFEQMDAETMFYEKMVGFEADENTVFVHAAPILAESWKASTDLKTYTFTLKKGIKWHNVAPVNGRELVADDVVFTSKRYMEADSNKYAKWRAVDTITAPDKYTVVITLKDPDAWAISNLFGTSEYIVAKESVDEGGGRIGSKAVGTGPYILKEYAPRRGYEFIRNPDYWAKDSKGNALPYIDTISSPFIGDVATVVAGYRTKQIDAGGSYGTNNQLIELGKSVPDLRVFNIGITQESGLAFNIKNAPWNDVRVRRAWNMLMDKEKYIQSAAATQYWEYTTPIPWALVSDEKFTFDKLGPYYRYNPTEAKKLLIEAGFPDGKMTLSTKLEFSTSPAHVIRSTIYQQLYKENGITFEITQMDTATYFQKWFERSHRDISLNFSNHGDWSLNWYAQNKYEKTANQNTSWVDDPEVTKWINEVKVTTDAAKIRQYAKNFWDYDTLQSVYVYTPVELTYTISAPRVRNFTTRRGASFTSQLVLPWLADGPRTTK